MDRFRLDGKRTERTSWPNGCIEQFKKSRCRKSFIQRTPGLEAFSSRARADALSKVTEAASGSAPAKALPAVTPSKTLDVTSGGERRAGVPGGRHDYHIDLADFDIGQKHLSAGRSRLPPE
jgi:hypothetical protein